MKKVGTIDYLVKEGKKMYKELKEELDMKVHYYGAESIEAQKVLEKLERVVTQLSKIANIDDIRDFAL